MRVITLSASWAAADSPMWLCAWNMFLALAKAPVDLAACFLPVSLPAYDQLQRTRMHAQEGDEGEMRGR